MSENLLVMIDSFGLGAFCTAFIFGMKNYKIFKGSRVLWAIFNLTMFVGIIGSLLSSLSWMGVYPEILQEIIQPLFFVITVLLVTFVIAENEAGKIA